MLGKGRTHIPCPPQNHAFQRAHNERRNSYFVSDEQGPAREALQRAQPTKASHILRRPAGGRAGRVDSGLFAPIGGGV